MSSGAQAYLSLWVQLERRERNPTGGLPGSDISTYGGHTGPGLAWYNIALGLAGYIVG